MRENIPSSKIRRNGREDKRSEEKRREEKRRIEMRRRDEEKKMR